jgi:hypothetical protein
MISTDKKKRSTSRFHRLVLRRFNSITVIYACDRTFVFYTFAQFRHKNQGLM